MEVVKPPEQLEEVEHADEILLQELRRTDELLLEELERVDEMLLRIIGEIDQLPDGVASAIGRRQLGSSQGNATASAKPTRGRGPARPFDPYPEGEAAAATEEKSAAAQVAAKLRGWVAAHGADEDAFRAATVSLAVSLLAAVIAVVGLLVAAL